MTTNHTVSLTLVDYIYICLYKKSRNLRGLWFLVELFVSLSLPVHLSHQMVQNLRAVPFQ